LQNSQSMARNAEHGDRAEGHILTRVRYPETDRMGIAHHAHYLVWFELARTEWMRELGIPYLELEQRDGIFLPVVQVGAAYHASARYDDIVRISACLAWVRRVRMRLEYAVTRQGDGLLLATGFTVHAAVDGEGRPRRLPERLVRALAGVAGESP